MEGTVFVKKIDSKKIKAIAGVLYLVASFFFIDAALRVLTRWLGYYSIYELAPNLFTLCWAVLITSVTMLFSQKAGRIVYAVVFFIYSILSLAQYGYYLIFGKFFYLSEAIYAVEGASYAGYVVSKLNWEFALMALGCVVAGVIGVLIFPSNRMLKRKHRIIICGCFFVVPCLFIWLIPQMYQSTDDKSTLFLNPQYEYKTFTNSGFDMELTGLYQYVAKDVKTILFDNKRNKTEQAETVDTFLSQKRKTHTNEMTGVLEGKNLILIQMESMDDWIISEEVTPTISRLMEDGICFSNHYACIYGSGSTFSTEFAVNTGIYQSVQGTAAYSCTGNAFPFSIANILSQKGYSGNSFHGNTGSYYNRNIMHTAMGYEKYTSTLDYLDSFTAAQIDENMIIDDGLWEKITGEEPFVSFLITYSLHVPYSTDDPVVQYALDKYPVYRTFSNSSELNGLYAKARLTDDMFSAILDRLSEDGLLENTAIIAYTDHYCYGLTDKALVDRLSGESGKMMECVPAFIWYAGCEPQTVDKVCQTIDWVPTIANLFGEDVSAYVLGNDIFSEEYPGWAIFPDGTWLTNEAYVVNGIVRRNEGLTSEEIAEMNSYVVDFYAANEAILASDYYRNLQK